MQVSKVFNKAGKGKEKVNLELTEYEAVEVTLEDFSVIETEEKNKAMMVGSLLTARPFNAQALKATMKGAWRLKNGFLFSELGHNLFLFQFVTEKDRESVEQGGPWSFDKSLLMLQDPKYDQPSQIVLKKAPFWIRVYDLPIKAMNMSTARAIGAVFGGLIELDEELILASEKFLRVRVMIDVMKPLRRGIILVFGGKKVWVEIKHERLPNFFTYAAV